MTEGLPSRISWDIHPIKEENIIKSIILCLIVLSIVIFSSIILGNLYGIITLFVFIFSLNKYFINTRYILDEDGLLINSKLFVTKKKWKYFQRYSYMGSHIGLSPEDRPTRLDNFRSTILKMPKNMDHAVIKSFIKSKME